mgnify:CR=1 FL=1
MFQRSPQLTTEQPIQLLALVGEFTESLKDKEKSNSAIREINRFVKFFHEDTDMNSITPSQIGAYAEIASKNSLSEEAMEGLQAVRKFLTFAYKYEKISTNLATHFRVRKTRSSGKNDDSKKRDSGQQMTQDGYDQLATEKESLESNRSAIGIAIQNAREDGDVRENAPLEAAREQQGREEARIKEIESMLRTAIIVDSSGKNTKRVRVGATIQVEELSKKKKVKYTLVSPSEASPLEGKISDASPLGKAFMGKRAGQRAIANTPRGETEFKIINIS